MMEKYEIQKLRDLPIEGVAERLGLSVKMHKALCPFHDDHHASLSFSVRRNTIRCFVCGAHGDPIDLVMRYLNKDFLDACRWLSLTPDPSPRERGEQRASQNNHQYLPPLGGWRGAPLMNKNTWKKIIDIVITILTAIATTLTATSCMGRGPLF